VRFANSDSNDPSFLALKTTVNGGQYNNSVESCVEACGAAGYNLAGVEFGLECCTCFHFVTLMDFSSPDQTLLLKGVTITVPRVVSRLSLR
jgi:hypothetical protein